MNPNVTKNYLFLKTLDDLDFIPLDSIAEHVLYNSIKQSLEQVGIAYSKAVIDHMCRMNGLSEREILTNCDLFEDSIYRLFGHGAISLINKVKVTALRTAILANKSDLTVPQILDPSLTLNDILREIRRIEALDFVNKMASYNQIAFLYSTEDSLSTVLAEYFGPKDVPKALLSENVGKYDQFNLSASISYRDLFRTSSDKLKGDAVTQLHDWLSQVRVTSTKSQSFTPTRFAEDDATWWIRNGHTRTFISIEQSARKEAPARTSILCAFNVSKLSVKELGTMKSVIQYYDYVIIEEPTFVVYKLTRPAFRHE
jgi:hypothetical protein